MWGRREVGVDAAVALEVLAPPSLLPALLYRVFTEQPAGMSMVSGLVLWGYCATDSWGPMMGGRWGWRRVSG